MASGWIEIQQSGNTTHGGGSAQNTQDTTTGSRSGARTGTTQVIEDAGFTVKFTIKVRAGLDGLSAPDPICTP